MLYRDVPVNYIGEANAVTGAELIRCLSAMESLSFIEDKARGFRQSRTQSYKTCGISKYFIPYTYVQDPIPTPYMTE